MSPPRKPARQRPPKDVYAPREPVEYVDTVVDPWRSMLDIMTGKVRATAGPEGERHLAGTLLASAGRDFDSVTVDDFLAGVHRMRGGDGRQEVG